MDVDVPARIIGGLGIAIGVAAIVVSWYLWQRSGPELRVEAFVRAATSTVHIEVTSVGRLAATVRTVELRDHLVIKPSEGTIPPLSRWALTALQPKGWPVDLPPSSYIEADVPVHDVIDKSAGVSQVSVQAWAKRGDGKWYSSKVIRVT